MQCKESLSEADIVDKFRLNGPWHIYLGFWHVCIVAISDLNRHDGVRIELPSIRFSGGGCDTRSASGLMNQYEQYMVVCFDSA